MKKPKAKTNPAELPALKPPETTLANAWQASLPQGATPFVGAIMWHDGFAVGHGTEWKYTAALRLIKYDKPLEHAGRKLFWAIEGVDYTRDLKTVLRIWGQTWFETEEQAKAELPNIEAWAKAEANKKIAAQLAAETHKPSSNEQDLAQARLKVMREQYPDTFKAMDTLKSTPPEARPEAWEALFRAYAVDLVRLRKPKNLGDISPFQILPPETSFILEIAKAHKAKSPYDPVDVEIAARWFSTGYDKMSLPEYTEAINAKTKSNLTPAAMEKRRYAKLSLMTKKPPGPPAKS